MRGRAPGSFAWVGFVSMLVAVPHATAGAETKAYPVRLDVERQPGSELCPDAVRVLGSLRGMFPTVPVERVAASDETTIAVSVVIRSLAEGHEAALSFGGARRGERTLVDRDTECRGLADAIAVAVALIVDPTAANAALAGQSVSTEATGAGSSPAEPPARPDRTATADLGTQPDAPPTEAAASEGGVRLGVDAGALGSVGLLGNPAFGGFVGAMLTAWDGPSLRVRGARLLATPTSVAPGRVHVDLWAAFVGACWRLPRGRRVAFTPCLDFGAGSQRGEGRGFTLEDGTVRRPFVSLGPSLTGSISMLAGVEASVTTGVAANLWQQDWVVPPAVLADGSSLGGGVQSQETIGAFVSVGVGTAWEFGQQHRGR